MTGSILPPPDVTQPHLQKPADNPPSSSSSSSSFLRHFKSSTSSSSSSSASPELIVPANVPLPVSPAPSNSSIFSLPQSARLPFWKSSSASGPPPSIPSSSSLEPVAPANVPLPVSPAPSTSSIYSLPSTGRLPFRKSPNSSGPTLSSTGGLPELVVPANVPLPVSPALSTSSVYNLPQSSRLPSRGNNTPSSSNSLSPPPTITIASASSSPKSVNNITFATDQQPYFVTSPSSSTSGTSYPNISSSSSIPSFSFNAAAYPTSTFIDPHSAQQRDFATYTTITATATANTAITSPSQVIVNPTTSASSSPTSPTPSSALAHTSDTTTIGLNINSEDPSSFSCYPPSRPMSMSIDTAQWNQGPGSFPPETTIATTTSTHPGLDSASSSLSQRSSREGSDDPYGSNINFVYANEKRFGDYHSLFRSVPEKEKLIEDYGCALQKEILVQGRLYISEDHVCFNANIFGWVTNLVIAFSEITAIEKRMTAFVIPNAISIVTATNTKGHFFASFLSRDAAHDLLMAAWRKSFPCAANASAASVHYTNGHSRSNRSTLTVDDIDDDAQSFISGRDSRKNRHRRSFSGASMADYNPENWNDESKGGDDDGAESSSLRRRGSKRAAVRKLIKDVIAPIIPDDDHRNGSSLSPNNSGKKTGRARSVSELPPRPVSFDGGPRDNHRESVGSTSRNSLDQDSLSPSFRPRSGTESSPSRHPDLYSAAAAFSKQSAPVLSIPAHGSKPSAPAAGTVVAGIAMAGPGRATTCKCSKDGRHYANTFMTETYPGSVEAMWKLLFDSNFAKEFLTSEAMKGADVQEDSWQKTSNGTSTKTTRYTKWLGMPIGPKTTKAILTDVCEIKNFEDYTTTVTTTSTPDVPSGGSFTTKVRTCITWAGPGQVQMVVTGAVEFTKSSWIKGQIEKGAAEGLTTHYKELNKTLRKYIAAHPKEFPAPGAAPVAAVAAPAVVSIQAAQPPPATAQSVQFESRPQSVAFEDEKHQQSQPRGSVSPFKSSPSKQVGLLDGIGSILSKALDSFKRVSSPSSTSARNRDSVEGPNLAVISVLVLLLAGNFYIWFQMSSVTAQVEQIQAHLMADGHPRPEKPPTPPPAPKQPAGQANTGGFKGSASRARQAWIDLNDDLLEREYEEDVMWAWLTERQARHQQYRRSSGFYYPTETIVRMEKEEQAEKEKERLSETETKLQARIQQLQDQVAELERHTSALKVGTRAAVLEQEEDIPVE